MHFKICHFYPYTLSIYKIRILEMETIEQFDARLRKLALTATTATALRISLNNNWSVTSVKSPINQISTVEKN